ncbi:M20 family metallopeptidase [Pelagibacterium sp.]|uniref:M20 family metallopeptidase n=1 Tax=Pelagibacterium sp. TaxID=1967288 RepID=UPI003A93D877
MTNPSLSASALEDILDRDDAIALLQKAIGRQSITGNEANFVDLLQAEMAARGLSGPIVEDFMPGRPNVWGTRKGNGGGPRLLFIGHTDTVHVDGWSDHWAGDAREDPFAAPIMEGEIWGRGAGDLKAGICTALSAISLLDSAGVSLKGDIDFAFVGDEESGQPGSGVSAGIKHYVEKIEAGDISRPDFVIYVEPTRLAVYPAQIGFFIADIKIEGKSAYFGVPELGHDALKASHKIMSALWAHSDAVSARARHDLIGNGFLLITTLEGGGYIAVPEHCSISLIRKLLPGEALDAAAAEIEATVRGAINDPNIRIEITYPAGRDHALGGEASEIDSSHPALVQLQSAIAEAMAGRGALEGAPFWSEKSFFTNRLGIPAVYCAPGDIRNCHTFEERVSVEEYLSGIVAFAIFIASYCGVESR